MQKHVCSDPPEPNYKGFNPTFPLQWLMQKTRQDHSSINEHEKPMIQDFLQYLDLITFIILSRQKDRCLVIQERFMTYF